YLSPEAVMRAVIYARYSVEMQAEASVEDQLRNAEAFIARQGWTYQPAYTDRAVSGATTLRSGYQQLLQDARAGVFDVVVAESLDRLSRDQADVASLHKHLTYQNVRLVTVSEGEIGELHVGLKGTMNALYLKDLATKTHRGLQGRVRAGKAAGGVSYGYDVVVEHDARGEPERGQRRINPEQAEVVRRIFRDFAGGRSPRLFTPRACPAPRGRPWRDTAIRGHQQRGTGILNNELYIGRLVWNRQRYVKDSETGRR
ncbi:MAG: recombinase family protein, partial [Thiohalorhabdaceae bacterium]